MSKKIVVIGSGSGGLTAAIGLAKVGYQVTIIEKAIIGGDCTNYGCVPSKALLFRSHKLHDTFSEFETTPELKKLFTKKAEQVLTDVRGVVKEFQDHESTQWLESYGIKVIYGEGKFLSPNSVIVDQQIIPFDKCVIATGSTTYVPHIEGIWDTPFLTNHTIFDLEKIPKSITIIGNGPIGVELGEAFSCLGSEVTIIGNSSNILGRSDRESSTKLQKYLENRKINFKVAMTKAAKFSGGQFHLEFEDGTSMKTQKLMIATGRKPNIELDLENANIKSHNKGVWVNKYARTSNPNVYAIGDVVSGHPNFTHFAYNMGKSVVTNLIAQKYLKLPIHVSKYQSDLVPAVTFTSLELAEAGYNEQDAKNKFGESRVHTYVYDFKDVDRTKTHEHEQGHIKLITKGFFGRIIGVSILSTRAGEILPEFQTMIATKKNMLFLNKLIRAYPSYTSSLDNLFKQWIYEKFLTKK